MVKKIGFVLAFMAALGLYAQDGSVSPYSYFGIGDSRALGTYENQMMGGIGMYADSIHVNLTNPAAYGKLGMSFGDDFGMTTYTAGISNKQLRLKSFTDLQSNRVTNLDYLAVGFSLKKGLGVGFGITPFSSIGYNLVGQTINPNGTEVTNQFVGSGGLNRVFLSIGWAFAKDFSVGVTGNFNFGRFENQRVQSVEGVQFGTVDDRISKVNGVDFNYALNYTPTIKDKYTLFASVRINTQANLSSENSQVIGSFSLQDNSNRETVNVDLDAVGLRNTDLKIPTTTTIGLGFGEERKWFLGAEYGFQGLSSFSNDFLDVDNLVYENASSFALGGFFIPNSSTFSSYWKRIVYRAGLRLDRTGMLVNDVDINNFGITFGFGLPMGRSRTIGSLSNINVGFELGRRGTTRADLIEESYFKFNVGLSLNDLWFLKRKIN